MDTHQRFVRFVCSTTRTASLQPLRTKQVRSSSGWMNILACIHVAVKLWSIKTTEEISNCQWTYSKHQRPVNALVFFPSLSYIASADNTVHIWDPFRGSAIHQLDWPCEVNSDHSIVALNRLSQSLLAIGASSENTIR